MRVTNYQAVSALCAGLIFGTLASPWANPILTPGVWKDISPSRSGGSEVWKVRVDPSNPNIIYAGTGAYVTGTHGDGLFKSTDAGSTWNQINVCPDIAGIEIDPHNSQHLYVGGWANGDFWESLDGGDSWIKKPLPGSPDIGEITVDPTDFKHILASWHFIFDGNGTFPASADGGNTWNRIDIPGLGGTPSKGVHFLYQPALNIGNSSTWLITQEGSGFFRTNDAGATWAKVADGTTGLHGGLKTTYYTKDKVLYMGGNPCPVRSTDNGITWESICGNLNGGYYGPIVGDGKNLYLGADAPNTPVYTSPERDGKHWVALGQTFSPGPCDMAFDSVNRILYMAQRTPGLYALKVDNSTTVAKEQSIKKNSASTGMRVIPAGTKALMPKIAGTVYDIRGKAIDRSRISAQAVIARIR